MDIRAKKKGNLSIEEGNQLDSSTAGFKQHRREDTEAVKGNFDVDVKKKQVDVKLTLRTLHIDRSMFDSLS
jgi:hypothetical protein